MAESDNYVNQADLRMALRAELAELELRLIDKLVTKSEHEGLKAEHAALTQRVAVIEQHGSPHMSALSDDVAVLNKGVDVLFAWRNRVLGAMAIITFSVTALATVSWHIWG